MENKQRLSNEYAVEQILEKCAKRNLSFIGFDNEENKYINHKTKLILKCNECGYEWRTTSYLKFVKQNINCQNCKVKNKPLSIEEKLIRINNVCENKNYAFLGFSDDGNLILKCNKCGNVWNTTSYKNFVTENRKSHSCGRNNPSFKEKEFNANKYIAKANEKLPSYLKAVGYKYGVTTAKDLTLKIKCNKCNEIFSYSYRIANDKNFDIKCKICERFNKFTNDEALEMINKACTEKYLDFLGFCNDENHYSNKNVKLFLKCNECGKIWNTTSFHRLIKTNANCSCRNDSLWKAEEYVEKILSNNNIEYEREKTFEWLKHKGYMRLDFYLPQYNIAIECQGRQHFQPVYDFGGEEYFKTQEALDKEKYKLCNEHGIKLLYFSTFKKYDTFLNEKLIRNENELLKEIKNGK